MATILVADDESDLRELIRRVLEQNGHQILEAENGPRALDILKQHDVDLLVLDVLLPGMDGYTLQLEMSQEQRTQNIPVVVLTALDLTKSLFTKFPQVREFVPKPFDPIKLSHLVTQILSETSK
jgi:CheY-like chemotaxis protein